MPERLKAGSSTVQSSPVRAPCKTGPIDGVRFDGQRRTIGIAARDREASRFGRQDAMTTYTIIIEDAGANLAAYVPDLPGCIGVADSVDELTVLMREAIEFHIEGLRLSGEEVPAPSTTAAAISIST